MSSSLVTGAGPLADPLLVCLRGISAKLPNDFPLWLRVEWKGGIVVDDDRLSVSISQWELNVDMSKKQLFLTI